MFSKVYDDLMSGADHGIIGKWDFSIDRFSSATSLETYAVRSPLP
jgi:hypothetical protein